MDAARRRDELLAVVSHDLRNPVTSIQLVAQQLRRTPAVDAKVLESAERILAIIGNRLHHPADDGAWASAREPHQQ